MSMWMRPGRAGLRAAALLACVALAGACGSPPPSGSPVVSPRPTASPGPVSWTLTGTYTLFDRLVLRDERGNCRGTGDHAGSRAGAPVIVLDRDSGREVARGELRDAPGHVPGQDAAEFLACWFLFTVPDVPELTGYEIAIDGSSVPYSREELAAVAGFFGFGVGPAAPQEQVIEGLTIEAIAEATRTECEQRPSSPWFQGEVRTWTCLGEDGPVQRALMVSTLEDGSVLAIRAVVAQREVPSDAVALEALGLIATLPWAGNEPDTAATWLATALGSDAQTSIGGVGLEVGADWPPASRGLVLRGDG